MDIQTLIISLQGMQDMNPDYHKKLLVKDRTGDLITRVNLIFPDKGEAYFELDGEEDYKCNECPRKIKEIPIRWFGHERE